MFLVNTQVGKIYHDTPYDAHSLSIQRLAIIEHSSSYEGPLERADITSR